MRAKVLAVLGVLIVASAAGFGVNTTLGDPPTQEIVAKEPKPEMTPAPPPPWLIAAENTGRARFAFPPQPIPDSINGKEITIPFGATIYPVTIPAPEDAGEVVTSWVVVVGESWVAFDRTGLLDSHIEAQDAEALAPLLEALE